MGIAKEMYEVGDRVWYLMRDGSKQAAKVDTVDRNVQPFSYGVILSSIGSVRETEGLRLRAMTAAEEVAAEAELAKLPVPPEEGGQSHPGATVISEGYTAPANHSLNQEQGFGPCIWAILMPSSASSHPDLFNSLETDYDALDGNIHTEQVSVVQTWHDATIRLQFEADLYAGGSKGTSQSCVCCALFIAGDRLLALIGSYFSIVHALYNKGQAK